MLFAEFQVGQVLWSIIWFTLFLLWILLVIRVVGDIFRSRDMSGAAKALWLVAILFTPYLGVFLYLIIRGGSMAEREVSRFEAQDQAFRAYIRDASGSSGAAELAQLQELREKGAIDDAEFQKLKARILAD